MMTVDKRIECVTSFIQNYKIADEDVRQNLYLLALEQTDIKSEEELTSKIQISYGQYLLNQIKTQQKKVVKPLSGTKVISLVNVKHTISMLSERYIMDDEDYINLLIELM